MTPYACGGETSIEETKMKNDITIEAEMKHLYDTTVRKGLPDDITIEDEMKHL